MLRLFALFILVAACGDDAPRVPPPEATTAPEAGDTSEPRLAEGRSLAAGTRAVSVEGAAIELTGEARALLTLDLDGDGDRDALLVRHDPEAGRVAITVAIREADRFRTRDLGPLATEGCALDAATLTQPTPTTLFGEARFTCPDDRPPLMHRWALSKAAPPRVRLTTSTRAGATLSFTPRDLDDDGHEDLEATLSLDGSEPLTFRWLDRPGGLALERGEPAATLTELLRTDAARGASLAAALCGPSALVRFGAGAWGLECPDAALAAAERATVDTSLRAGDLIAAFVALDEGGAASPAALDAVAAPGVTQTELPFTYRSEPSVDPKHVALAFDGEEIIVFGATADALRPGGLTRPADAEPLPIRSSDLRFAVLGVRDRCQRAEITLARAAGDDAPLSFASRRPAHAVSLFVAEDQAPCAERPSPWRVLGWAPQGLLAARAGERRVIPLTTEALATGEPMVLGADDPWPAPARGGRITPDGSTWILERAEGVLHVSPAGAALWRPSGWASSPAPSAAAISDDGERVVLLVGERLLLLRAPGASPSPGRDGDDVGN